MVIKLTDWKYEVLYHSGSQPYAKLFLLGNSVSSGAGSQLYGELDLPETPVGYYNPCQTRSLLEQDSKMPTIINKWRIPIVLRREVSISSTL
ncbi:hypothetical protein CDQ84_10340 [Clostridium thermosuccinogenes]|uniref:Uncharacterized protein n=1 Tax=Clostridium thermosuccinogenes TaxID=84032 RepID=A0A2K2FJ88_9CLOT|nr:hypothetical protein [Pseudoclostridium thermosuccinogenes]AUS97525.1 hypothetical protein CDO33_14395 [Pseudoclostridium thermosuccinogenes]PNT93780.1 hypothetical protein CDQ83_09900 [Pseudoclostridium thermosuccinogenes]PNT96950.1 hypothetical protein CDQ85_10190 [Pseudoclostridium thermosuccinogenes]PNT98833.1 hypothetical protein CDQ84_10340 [Pseudoclostridium thermosuccinogenes]